MDSAARAAGTTLRIADDATIDIPRGLTIRP
jgi:hypothetical protein